MIKLWLPDECFYGIAESVRVWVSDSVPSLVPFSFGWSDFYVIALVLAYILLCYILKDECKPSH